MFGDSPPNSRVWLLEGAVEVVLITERANLSRRGLGAGGDPAQRVEATEACRQFTVADFGEESPHAGHRGAGTGGGQSP